MKKQLPLILDLRSVMEIWRMLGRYLVIVISIPSLSIFSLLSDLVRSSSRTFYFVNKWLIILIFIAATKILGYLKTFGILLCMPNCYVHCYVMQNANCNSHFRKRVILSAPPVII